MAPPSSNWGNQKEWPPKNTEFKRTEFTLKSKLLKMSMNELRKFAKDNNLKAKDNDKSELIEELIKESEEMK